MSRGVLGPNAHFTSGVKKRFGRGKKFRCIYIAVYPWIGGDDVSNPVRVLQQHPFGAGFERCREQLFSGPCRKITRMAAPLSIGRDDNGSGLFRDRVEDRFNRGNGYERMIDWPEQKARFRVAGLQPEPERAEWAVIGARVDEPGSAGWFDKKFRFFIMGLADKHKGAETAAHGFDACKQMFQKRDATQMDMLFRAPHAARMACKQADDRRLVPGIIVR